MKYAIFILIFIVIIFILSILYLKRINGSRDNKEIKMDFTTKEIPENKNPTTEITLIEYQKYQLNIYYSQIGDKLKFKKDTNKRIKVLNNSKCIGFIPAKEVRKIELLEQFPDYYEGTVTQFINADIATKKVSITLQIKTSCSKKVYNTDHNYLNKLVNIHTLFEPNQIVETSYGPSTILEVHDHYLVVDVPSLGKREIYNITEINL